MHLPSLMAAGLTAVFAASAAAQTPAPVDPSPAGSGRAIYVVQDRAAARAVAYIHRNQFSYVRIETREPGAPANEHPYAIEPATLRAALAALTLTEGSNAPVFGDDQLAELVAPLAQALGRATAEQDVTFAVPGRHGFAGPLAARSITTARVFRRDGRLQVIVGLLRTPFESQYRATGYLIPFEPGQRSEPVSRDTRIGIAPAAGRSVRADWVALDLAAVPVAAAPASVPAAPAGTAAPATTGTAPAPAAARPAATAPAPAASTPAAPAAAAAEQSAPDADALAQRTGERLKALKKLRDQNLISEQEYQAKRAQILKDL